MEKLPKYLIFCKLRYVTNHQRLCRYCGIIQKAPGAWVSLLTWPSRASARDLLLGANWSGRAASSQPGLLEPEQELSPYSSTT